MDYVTIRGKDLNDCFMQMKMKYGPEAHVYEKRVIQEGGLFGTGFLANKIYEIKVAIPEKASSKERVEKKLNDLRELLRKKTREEKKEDSPSTQVSKAHTPKETPSSISFSKIPTFSDWAVDPAKKTNPPEEEESPVFEPTGGLSFAQEWFHKIPKDKEPLDPTTKKGFQEWPASLQKLESKLIEEGMSPTYTKALLEEVQLHLPPVEAARYASVLERACEVIAQKIQTNSDLLAKTPRGKRKVVFFIGPTGSGKTTTLAKLAAKYHFHSGKTVSMYTTDNYRIAAVEQLNRYAEIIGLPFYFAKEIRGFREALLRDGSELVLIDTAGYNHRDKESFNKMKQFYEALSENDHMENILVISTTVSRSNAVQVMEAYAELGYNRVILSKVDEADYLGSFVELADNFGKEFAYLCVGQEVPFDILGAEKKLLAECVIYPEKMKGIKGEIFSRKS